MEGARNKMLLICLGTNKTLFIPEIMKLRVKTRINVLPKLNEIRFSPKLFIKKVPFMFTFLLFVFWNLQTLNTL